MMDQRQLAEYLRRLQAQGLDPTAPPITMESQVNAAMAAPMRPGTGGFGDQPRAPDPRAVAAASLKGRENEVKSQRAYAQSLRDLAPSLKGQTVGPLDVYVGPKWGDMVGNAGVNAISGYMTGRANRADTALDEERTAQAEAALEYQEGLTDEERGFTAEQARLKQAVDREIAQARNKTTQRGQDLTATSSAASTAATLRGQDITADTAAANRTANMTTDNYSLDGRVIHAVRDPATGQFHLGDIQGPAIPSSDMERAVLYRPGTAEGTLADEQAFQMPVEESGQATPRFMGNLLTSDYFDKSTGAFNPERWGGELAVGPDGEMVQATQSQMATATLGSMSQRMEEINLRPWTEKEIETITADFPGKNSKYPDWANFTTNIMIPKFKARFAEAINDGRSTPEQRDATIAQMYNDVIEGAAKNNMKMEDLERLGVPEDVIVAYLKRKR